ncbi:MAG TPA: hypothetical protein PLS70_15995 [Acidobacteriota bacterium]|nr:hypothetical protein [Acidobacteriota bacterium]
MFKPRFGYLAVVAIALQFCGNSLFAQSVPGEIPGLQKTRKPANKVNLGPTTGLGADKQGRIYIVSNTRNRVYRYDPAKNAVSVVAGNGQAVTSGDGGPASEAGLKYITDVAVDREGNVYIGQIANGLIRKVDAETQIITTIAGGGVKHPEDGMLATDAFFDYTDGLLINLEGNLVFVTRDTTWEMDLFTQRLTKIAGGVGNPATIDGEPATTVSVFGTKVAQTADGDYLITECYRNQIRRVDSETKLVSTIAGKYSGQFGAFEGDGGLAESAFLAGPSGITVDKDGTIYFIDSRNNRIRRIDPKTKRIKTIAGSGSRKFSGDGGPATLAGLGFEYPTNYNVINNSDLVADGLGNLYVADTFNNCVRKINLVTGVITTAAGIPL